MVLALVEETSSPSSSRLYRLGIPQTQKANESADERPQLRASCVRLPEKSSIKTFLNLSVSPNPSNLGVEYIDQPKVESAKGFLKGATSKMA